MHASVPSAQLPVSVPADRRRPAPGRRIVWALMTVLWLWPVPALAKVTLVFGMFAPDNAAARADSDITEVGQLRGRSVAFGPASATLARYVVQHFLLDQGIRARDLARYEYYSRHDKIGRAVSAGTYDAGVLEETTFTDLVQSGVPLRAIATFESATRPWVARAGLDRRVETALHDSLVRLTDEPALAALRFEGFLAGDDSEYEETRAAVRDNPRFFE